jgi:hypothetical protein
VAFVDDESGDEAFCSGAEWDDDNPYTGKAGFDLAERNMGLFRCDICANTRGGAAGATCTGIVDGAAAGATVAGDGDGGATCGSSEEVLATGTAPAPGEFAPGVVSKGDEAARTFLVDGGLSKIRDPLLRGLEPSLGLLPLNEDLRIELRAMLSSSIPRSDPRRGLLVRLLCPLLVVLLEAKWGAEALAITMSLRPYTLSSNNSIC